MQYLQDTETRALENSPRYVLRGISGHSGAPSCEIASHSIDNARALVSHRSMLVLGVIVAWTLLCAMLDLASVRGLDDSIK